MGNIFDPGGLFANTDGIDPVVSSGTPLGYDLTQLLSASMRARPPWMSFAQVASNVLYEYVEQNRIALELSRDPTHIERALKITLLKMLGLDWNSDIVTDDAYDRLIESVSLYLQNHGPGDFINYIGYSLGFSTQMITLWTRDYKGFFPGPQTPNILQYKPGTQIPDNNTVYYPTSHVGLLYELYAENAPNAEQIVQIKDIFYRIAPIHLVLEFIGAMITGSVGTLYICTESYMKGEFTAIAEYLPTLILYFSANTYSIQTQIAHANPLHPNRELEGNFGSYSIETGLDKAIAQSVATVWSAGYQPLIPDVTYNGGYDVPSTYSGQMYWSLQPNDTWSLPTSFEKGLLVQPALKLLVSSSSNPLTSNWGAYGIQIQPNYVRLDSHEMGYNVSSIYDGGSIQSGLIEDDIGCVILTFRPTNTDEITISRGIDSITFTVSTKQISASAGVGNYGYYYLGSGFYCLWGVMSGSIITVFPGGESGQGSFDWLDFQVLSNFYWPCPVPVTIPSPDAVYFLPQTFNQFNSVLAQILYQYNVNLGLVGEPVKYELDLGSVSDSNIDHYLDAGLPDIEVTSQLLSGANVDLGKIIGGQFYYEGYTDSVVTTITDLGSVLLDVDQIVDLGDLSKQYQLPENVYYFYDGIAEVGYGFSPLTNSISSSVVGTSLDVDFENFNNPYGVALFTICPLYPYWKNSVVDILNIEDARGGLHIRADDTNITLTLHNGVRHMTLIDGFMRIAISWSPTEVFIFINGQTVGFSDSLAEVFSINLFSNTASAEFTWLLKNLLIMGSDSNSKIPSIPYQLKYSGSLFYYVQHNFIHDMGKIFSQIFLSEDSGKVSSSVVNSLDLGNVA